MTTEEGKLAGFQGWAILELMGYRKAGAYISEQEIAGRKFLRVQVPLEAGDLVQYYRPELVFCITEVGEGEAREFARYHNLDPRGGSRPRREDHAGTDEEDVPF